MSALGFCKRCGKAMAPAASFMTEEGPLCASCFPLWEAEHRAAQNAAAAKDVALFRQAKRLAGLHGLNWAAACILFAGWVHVATWLSSTLVAGALVMAVGLRFQSSSAFRAALVVDTVGALVLLVESIRELSGGRLLFLLFPVLFAWWLGWLTWRARAAFVVKSRF